MGAAMKRIRDRVAKPQKKEAMPREPGLQARKRHREEPTASDQEPDMEQSAQTQDSQDCPLYLFSASQSYMDSS